MLTWLGITTGVDHCSSVLEVCYQSPILIPVIDGGRHVYDDQLRDTFSSPDRHTLGAKLKQAHSKILTRLLAERAGRQYRVMNESNNLPRFLLSGPRQGLPVHSATLVHGLP